MKEKYNGWAQELFKYDEDNDDVSYRAIGMILVAVLFLCGFVILTGETFGKYDPTKALMSGTSYALFLILYFFISEALLITYNYISKNYYRDLVDAVVAKLFMLGFPILLALSPLYFIAYLNYKLFDKRRK